MSVMFKFYKSQLNKIIVVSIVVITIALYK